MAKVLLCCKENMDLWCEYTAETWNGGLTSLDTRER